MKLFIKTLTTAAMFALASGSAYALAVADVAFVVDESGSMDTEHTWLGSAATSLENGLIAAQIGDGTDASDFNQYALVGFGAGGSSTPPTGIDQNGRGNNNYMSASQFDTATGNLVLTGFTEDGYAGIDYYFNNYTQRGGAAQNVVLVTDEDRDNTNNSLTFASMEALFDAQDALLNAVVNVIFRDSQNRVLLGVDSNDNGYLADGNGGYTVVDVSGGYTTQAGSNPSAGSSVADYVDLALATGGAAWDLNQLRAGGLTADSFTAAFVDIKVGEIEEQIPNGTAPTPGTLLLVGLGLAGLGLRRKIA